MTDADKRLIERSRRLVESRRFEFATSERRDVVNDMLTLLATRLEEALRDVERIEWLSEQPNAHFVLAWRGWDGSAPWRAAIDAARGEKRDAE